MALTSLQNFDRRPRQLNMLFTARLIALLLLCLSLLLLSGCGFKLRGTAGGGALNLPAMFIQADELNPALVALRQRLGQRGVGTVNEPAAARLILTLGNEARQRKVLSVSTAGKIQEYQLRYSLQFSLRDVDGVPRLASQTISLTRSYAYDDLDVMAKSEEQEALYRSMRQEAVQRIIRRLQSLSVSPVQDQAQELEPLLQSSPDVQSSAQPE